MKILKKSLVLITTFTLLLACFGCGNSGTYFEVPAFTENSDSEAYDSTYFYRNDLTLFGADACCIYVPEGRHTDSDNNDEYGGYYYMYPSATNIGSQGLIAQSVDGTNTQYSDENGTYFVTNPVYRSKNLVDWELCGAIDGTHSTKVYSDEWALTGLCAPDTIYDPVSGKYFIYEQTASHLKDDDPSLYTDCPTSDKCGTGSYKYWDRYFIGIYVSDYPTGPFRVVTSEEYYGSATAENLNGEVVTQYNPPINFQKAYGIDIPWGVIDAHPFIDENGDIYLYFCHHVDSAHTGVDIWGMKMKDMITPDYSTLTFLLKSGYETITKDETKWAEAPWSDDSYIMGDAYTFDTGTDGSVNEGAFMMAKNYTNENGETVRRYILCYSAGGFNNKQYDISQTLSDGEPLGPFKKIKQYAAAVVGTSFDNSWQMGCGHGCIVSSPDEDEMFILGWSHVNDDYDAANEGRYYSLDKVHWIDNEEYGLLLYGNGPTKSCQPRMYSTIGVHNVATNATVSVKTKGDYSGVEYLNDELFVSHSYYSKYEFYTEQEATITFTFSEPTTIASVLVYNTYDYNYAFSGIDYIDFDIAEKPTWYTASKFYSNGRISDVAFSSDFIGTTYDYIESGAACLASFNKMKVNSVTIKVSKKIKDNAEFEGIKISDVVILGE